MDTNIFLSHLKSIKQIQTDSNLEHLLFVVPWVIVQELDNCKNKKDYSENINKKAQESIKFILNLLQSKSERFHFETALQVTNYKLKSYKTCIKNNTYK